MSKAKRSSPVVTGTETRADSTRLPLLEPPPSPSPLPPQPASPSLFTVGDSRLTSATGTQLVRRGPSSSLSADKDNTAEQQKPFLLYSASGRLLGRREATDVWGLLVSENATVRCTYGRHRTVRVGRKGDACEVVVRDQRVSSVHFTISLDLEPYDPLDLLLSTSRAGEKQVGNSDKGASFLSTPPLRSAEPTTAKAERTSKNKSGPTDAHKNDDDSDDDDDELVARAQALLSPSTPPSLTPQDLRLPGWRIRRVLLTDCSANGTFVNDELLGRGHHRELHNGNDISIVRIVEEKATTAQQQQQRGASPTPSCATTVTSNDGDEEGGEEGEAQERSLIRQSKRALRRAKREKGVHSASADAAVRQQQQPQQQQQRRRRAREEGDDDGYEDDENDNEERAGFCDPASSPSGSSAAATRRSLHDDLEVTQMFTTLLSNLSSEHTYLERFCFHYYNAEEQPRLVSPKSAAETAAMPTFGLSTSRPPPHHHHRLSQQQHQGGLTAPAVSVMSGPANAASVLSPSNLIHPESATDASVSGSSHQRSVRFLDAPKSEGGLRNRDAVDEENTDASTRPDHTSAFTAVDISQDRSSSTGRPPPPQLSSSSSSSPSSHAATKAVRALTSRQEQVVSTLVTPYALLKSKPSIRDSFIAPITLSEREGSTASSVGAAPPNMATTTATTTVTPTASSTHHPPHLASSSLLSSSTSSANAATRFHERLLISPSAQRKAAAQQQRAAARHGDLTSLAHPPARQNAVGALGSVLRDVPPDMPIRYAVLPLRHLQWGGRIGYGASGEVFLGIDVSTATVVAIKVLKGPSLFHTPGHDEGGGGGGGGLVPAGVSGGEKGGHSPAAVRPEEDTLLSISDVSLGNSPTTSPSTSPSSSASVATSASTSLSHSASASRGTPLTPRLSAEGENEESTRGTHRTDTTASNTSARRNSGNSTFLVSCGGGTATPSSSSPSSLTATPSTLTPATTPRSVGGRDGSALRRNEEESAPASVATTPRTPASTTSSLTAAGASPTAVRATASAAELPRRLDALALTPTMRSQQQGQLDATHEVVATRASPSQQQQQQRQQQQAGHEKPPRDAHPIIRKHLREIIFLTTLQHHRIVRFLGFQFNVEGRLCLLMEYVAGGTLQTLIRNFGAFEENVIRLYTLQILEGLEYLARKGVVHGDMKSANILVSEQGSVKLTDFGTSRFLRDVASDEAAAEKERATATRRRSRDGTAARHSAHQHRHSQNSSQHLAGNADGHGDSNPLHGNEEAELPPSTSPSDSTTASSDGNYEDEAEDASAAQRVLCGTPLYMSPELIRTQDPSFASDMWALGCVVFEMATGGVLPWRAVHHSNASAVIWYIGQRERPCDGPSLDDVYAERQRLNEAAEMRGDMEDDEYTDESSEEVDEEEMAEGGGGSGARHAHGSHPDSHRHHHTNNNNDNDSDGEYGVRRRRRVATPSPMLVDLLRCTLNMNPAERPTAAELLQHPFIRGENSMSALRKWHATIAARRQTPKAVTAGGRADAADEESGGGGRGRQGTDQQQQQQEQRDEEEAVAAEGVGESSPQRRSTTLQQQQQQRSSQRASFTRSSTRSPFESAALTTEQTQNSFTSTPQQSTVLSVTSGRGGPPAGSPSHRTPPPHPRLSVLVEEVIDNDEEGGQDSHHHQQNRNADRVVLSGAEDAEETGDDDVPRTQRLSALRTPGHSSPSLARAANSASTTPPPPPCSVSEPPTTALTQPSPPSTSLAPLLTNVSGGGGGGGGTDRGDIWEDVRPLTPQATSLTQQRDSRSVALAETNTVHLSDATLFATPPPPPPPPPPLPHAVGGHAGSPPTETPSVLGEGNPDSQPLIHEPPRRRAQQHNSTAADALLGAAPPPSLLLLGASATGATPSPLPSMPLAPSGAHGGSVNAGLTAASCAQPLSPPHLVGSQFKVPLPRSQANASTGRGQQQQAYSGGAASQPVSGAYRRSNIAQHQQFLKQNEQARRSSSLAPLPQQQQPLSSRQLRGRQRTEVPPLSLPTYNAATHQQLQQQSVLGSSANYMYQHPQVNTQTMEFYIPRSFASQPLPQGHHAPRNRSTKARGTAHSGSANNANNSSGNSGIIAEGLGGGGGAVGGTAAQSQPVHSTQRSGKHRRKHKQHGDPHHSSSSTSNNTGGGGHPSSSSAAAAAATTAVAGVVDRDAPRADHAGLRSPRSGGPRAGPVLPMESGPDAALYRPQNQQHAFLQPPSQAGWRPGELTMEVGRMTLSSPRGATASAPVSAFAGAVFNSNSSSSAGGGNGGSGGAAAAQQQQQQQRELFRSGVYDNTRQGLRYGSQGNSMLLAPAPQTLLQQQQQPFFGPGAAPASPLGFATNAYSSNNNNTTTTAMSASAVAVLGEGSRTRRTPIRRPREGRVSGRNVLRALQMADGVPQGEGRQRRSSIGRFRSYKGGYEHQHQQQRRRRHPQQQQQQQEGTVRQDRRVQGPAAVTSGGNGNRNNATNVGGGRSAVLPSPASSHAEAAQKPQTEASGSVTAPAAVQERPSRGEATRSSRRRSSLRGRSAAKKESRDRSKA